MERRRALVVAGTMTATLAMAGTAMAVNLGLLSSDHDPVGDLTATEIQPAAQREADPTGSGVRIILRDIPVEADATGSSIGDVDDDDGPAHDGDDHDVDDD